MRKFNYDENDEYREGVDRFFSEDGENISDSEYKAIMEQEMQLEELQLRFVHRDLNHRVLRTAIRMCEKSFWWRFYSQDTKLKMVDRVYKKLRKLEEE